MAELECCPCGIARVDCDYHKPEPPSKQSALDRLRAMVRQRQGRPFVGDFVGIDVNDGDWLYIGAVDYDARLVRIGPMTGSLSDWLTETQARAIYNYEWAARVNPPM